MLMSERHTFEPEILDGIGELANMILGSAKEESRSSSGRCGWPSQRDCREGLPSAKGCSLPVVRDEVRPRRQRILDLALRRG